MLVNVTACFLSLSANEMYNRWRRFFSPSTNPTILLSSSVTKRQTLFIPNHHRYRLRWVRHAESLTPGKFGVSWRFVWNGGYVPCQWFACRPLDHHLTSSFAISTSIIPPVLWLPCAASSRQISRRWNLYGFFQTAAAQFCTTSNEDLLGRPSCYIHRYMADMFCFPDEIRQQHEMLHLTAVVQLWWSVERKPVFCVRCSIAVLNLATHVSVLVSYSKIFL